LPILFHLLGSRSGGLFCARDGLSEFLHLFFKAVDTEKGNQVTHTYHQDSGADEGGESNSGDVRIAKAPDTQDYAGDAEQQESPPVRETDFLVVETVDSDKNAFYNDPDHKDNRQRSGNEEIVAQEDDTDDNLKDGAEHAAGAVGKELLRLESEDQLEDTGHKREATDGPCRSKESGCGLADAHDAKGYQENAGYAQPDFVSLLHCLMVLVFS